MGATLIPLEVAQHTDFWNPVNSIRYSYINILGNRVPGYREGWTPRLSGA